MEICVSQSMSGAKKGRWRCHVGYEDSLVGGLVPCRGAGKCDPYGIIWGGGVTQEGYRWF